MYNNVKKETSTTPTKAQVEVSKKEKKKNSFSLPFYHKKDGLSTLLEYSMGINDPKCVVCGKTFIKYRGREYAYGDCCSHSCSKTKERSKSNNIPNAKPVVQIEQKSGKVVQTFQSAIEAALYIGMKKADGIRDCCNGKTKTSGGYIWRWKEKFEND
jgi:hypothetical protein